MEVEKIGEFYDYKFNFAEFVVTCGALKFLDEQRRMGQSSDEVRLHSAIRPIFTEGAPDNDDEKPVRWIYGSTETQAGGHREATPAPSIDTLLELTEHVIGAFEVPSLQHLLDFPIGGLVLERPADRPAVSRTTFQRESLVQLRGHLSQFQLVLLGHRQELNED